MPRGKTERVTIPSGEPDGEVGKPNEQLAGSDESIGNGNGEGNSGSDTSATAETTGTDSELNGAGSGYRIGDDPRDDGDPRIIRDEQGRPTFSPSGRLRKRRDGSGGVSGGTTSSQSGARPARKKVPVDALSRLLLMSHVILANVTKTPELEINEDESMMIANPLSELLVLYEVQVDPRILQAMELAGACSYVYGPRIYMIRERLKEEAQARKNARDAANARQVVPIGGGGPNFRSNANPEAGPLDVIMNG